MGVAATSVCGMLEIGRQCKRRMQQSDEEKETSARKKRRVQERDPNVTESSRCSEDRLHCLEEQVQHLTTLVNQYSDNCSRKIVCSPVSSLSNRAQAMALVLAEAVPVNTGTSTVASAVAGFLQGSIGRYAVAATSVCGMKDKSSFNQMWGLLNESSESSGTDIQILNESSGTDIQVLNESPESSGTDIQIIDDDPMHMQLIIV